MSDKINELGENGELESSSPISGTVKKEDININKNIGSFGDNVDTSSNAFEDPVSDTIEKKKIKINFEKFNTFKNFSNTKWGKVKSVLDRYLSNSLSYKIIWAIYAGILAIAITLSISFIVIIDRNLGLHDHNYNNIKAMVDTGLTGEIMSYIVLGLPIIPLFFLFICWLVQINGVVKSLRFHLFVIFTLIILCLVLIPSTVVSSIYIHYSSIETFQ